MIRVKYDKEKNGVFDFEVDYRGDRFKELNNAFGEYTDVAFFYTVLNTCELIKHIDIRRMIWSTDILYRFCGKNFGLVFDEDYLVVSCFFVENPEDRLEVASFIHELLLSKEDIKISVSKETITFIDLLKRKPE